MANSSNPFYLFRPLPDGIGQITQAFGENPEVYKIFGLRGHNGADYGAVGPDPVPILAAHDGTVSEVGYDEKGYGNFVRIEGLAWITLYGHMKDGSIRVFSGQRVKAGDRIGDMGSTGFSTGRHLHFAGRGDGIVNPGFSDYLDVIGFRVLTDKLSGGS